MMPKILKNSPYLIMISRTNLKDNLKINKKFIKFLKMNNTNLTFKFNMNFKRLSWYL